MKKGMKIIIPLVIATVIIGGVIIWKRKKMPGMVSGSDTPGNGDNTISDKSMGITKTFESASEGWTPFYRTRKYVNNTLKSTDSRRDSVQFGLKGPHPEFKIGQKIEVQDGMYKGEHIVWYVYRNSGKTETLVYTKTPYNGDASGNLKIKK